VVGWYNWEPKVASEGARRSAIRLGLTVQEPRVVSDGEARERTESQEIEACIDTTAI
jgi:hypothetical protein